MNDLILKIPAWEGQITFSSEMVTLILVCVSLIAGVLLCFWGYRYFQTVVLVVLGCGCGFLGYGISQNMTQIPVLQMLFWVMFMFLGICMFYFLSIVWVYITKKMGIYAFLQRKLHYIAILLGALFVGMIIYTQVFSNIYAAICITVFLAITGIWYGKRNVEEIRVFYTYDDLLKLKPLTEEKSNV